VFTYIGAAVMAFGLFFESLADVQKNAAKKINPRRFVDTGLYRIVRCPNYLCEMLFWTGVLISGIGAVSGIGQWIMVLIGYIGIIYVMFSGARRLEIRQNKNYGSDPEYQTYIKTVPILLPFLPLYSVEKHKWLVA
jgi:steroid 5-alpha reductase family enzyme